jgi:hypothetical protein
VWVSVTWHGEEGVVRSESSQRKHGDGCRGDRGLSSTVRWKDDAACSAGSNVLVVDRGSRRGFCGLSVRMSFEIEKEALVEADGPGAQLGITLTPS